MVTYHLKPFNFNIQLSENLFFFNTTRKKLIKAYSAVHVTQKIKYLTYEFLKSHKYERLRSTISYYV